MAFVMSAVQQTTSSNGEPSRGLMDLIVNEQQKQQRRQFQLLCRRKSRYQQNNQKGTLLQVSSRTLSLGYLPVTRKWIMLDTERQRLQSRISGDHHHPEQQQQPNPQEVVRIGASPPRSSASSTTGPTQQPPRASVGNNSSSSSSPVPSDETPGVVQGMPSTPVPSTPVRRCTNNNPISTPRSAPPAIGGGNNTSNKTNVKPVSSMVFTRPESIQETKPSSSSSSSSSSRYHLSYKSSLSNLFLKRKKRPVNMLVNLPAEVLQLTCSYLDQEDVYSMALVHSGVSPFAYDDLYRAPRFISTYRLAQFVSTVTHNENLAKLVRVIDLSELQFPEQGNRILAGWRDWKYRGESIYHIGDGQRPGSNGIFSSPLPKYYYHHHHHHNHHHHKDKSYMQQNYTSCGRRNASAPSSMSLHPSLSPLLKQYALVKDVPFGYIMHLALSCTNITMIDLSMVPLSEDYQVNSPRHRPTAFTNKIYVSDVPRVNTWKDGETKRITRGEVIETIMSLENLHTLRLRNLVWVGEDIVHKIVFEEEEQDELASSKSVPSSPNLLCERVQSPPANTRRRSSSLKNVDFSDCGMSKGKSWAINGSLDDVKSILLGQHNAKEGDEEEEEEEDEEGGFY